MLTLPPLLVQASGCAPVLWDPSLRILHGWEPTSSQGTLKPSLIQPH